jgi:hypothetical protein
MASIRHRARQRALKTNWWVALVFSLACRITGPAPAAKTRFEYLIESESYLPDRAPDSPPQATGEYRAERRQRPVAIMAEGPARRLVKSPPSGSAPVTPICPRPDRFVEHELELHPPFDSGAALLTSSARVTGTPTSSCGSFREVVASLSQLDDARRRLRRFMRFLQDPRCAADIGSSSSG